VTIDSVLVDVELLSPDRLVRYLARRVRREFVERLAEAWIQCAKDAYPEQSVATVEDAGAGLAVVVAPEHPNGSRLWGVHSIREVG